MLNRLGIIIFVEKFRFYDLDQHVSCLEYYSKYLLSSCDYNKFIQFPLNLKRE